jgi:transcriptional regulator with XRE-family HTH domain
MVELLLEIDKVQIKYNLNDSQFAKSLGVDPALVSRLKRGLTVPGADFLGCLARVYPELDIIVIQYLKGRGQGDGKSG